MWPVFISFVGKMCLGQSTEERKHWEMDIVCFGLFIGFVDYDKNIGHHRPYPFKAWFSVQSWHHLLTSQIFPSFCVLWRVGDESQGRQNGLLDISFHSLAQHGDAFGDEDKGFDLLGSDCELIWNSFCHISLWTKYGYLSSAWNCYYVFGEMSQLIL